MYCSKCGKQLPEGSTDTLCEDCKAAAEQAATSANQQTQAPVQQNAQEPIYNSRMYGFGPALTSTILSIIGFILACFAYGWELGVSSQAKDITYSAEVSAVATTGIVFIIIALALTIPALILGIKSINKFKAAKRANGVTPIPALVLGIIGTAYAALSLLFVLIAFFMMLSVL